MVQLRTFQQRAKTLIESSNFRGVMVVAPTGAGKTFIVNFLVPQGRTIIIGPLRALSSEQYSSFSQQYKSILDTGDVRARTKEYKSAWEIAIMTYERFDSILRSEKKREEVLDEVKYLVIDEIHQIGRDRGGRIESALFKLRKLYPHIKLVCLSATIANPQNIAEWLDLDLIIDEEPRPIPLDIKFYTYRTQYTTGSALAEEWHILQKIFQNHAHESFLIFCGPRWHAHDLACMDANILKSTPQALWTMIPLGVAFHHAGLSSTERNRVETAFQQKKVQHLYSTPTLSQGVNLPARHVVIFDVTRWSWLKSAAEYIGVDELNQMIGRAGRPGLDDRGYAHIICSEHQLWDVKKLLSSSFVAQSKIHPSIREMLLEWNVTGVVETEADFDKIPPLLYCGKAGDPPLETKDFREAMGWLVRKGFVAQRRSYFVPTHKGRMTSLMYISPETTRVFEDGYKLIVNMRTGGVEIPLKFIFSLLLHTEEFLGMIVIRHKKVDQQFVDIGRKELGYYYCTKCQKIRRTEKALCCDGRKVSLCPDPRMMKAYALAFAKDMSRKYQVKLPISTGDRKMLISQAQRLLGAEMTIIPDKLLGERVRRLSILVGRGIARESFAELLKVQGIGERYIERLANEKINTIAQLVEADRQTLLRVFNSRKTVDRILTNARQLTA